MNAAKRPKAYVCYLCGAQFGSSSLWIHVANCQAKWQKKEAEKPKRERRPLPPPPAELESGEVPTTPSAIDDFNARMFEYYNRISLCQCARCGRSFNEEAFARHQTICTAETPGGPHAKRAPGASSTMGSGPSRMATGGGAGAGGGPTQKPRAYTCFLCGQQYGSKSLPIHIPQCQEKWAKVQSAKPKGEQRPVPPMPFDLDEPLPTSPEGIDEFNSKMFNFYNGVSLYQCKGCGRSFHAEAYEKHKLRCAGAIAPPNQASPTSGGASPKAPSPREAAAPPGFMCHLCGEHQSRETLKAHVGACQQAYGSSAVPPYDPAAELPLDAEGIACFNARAEAVYSGEGLSSCEHCGRSFKAHAFKNHRKICTAERPFKPAPPSASMSPHGAGAGAAPGKAGGAEAQHVECGGALARHARVCTAAKSMKPVHKPPGATTDSAAPISGDTISVERSAAAPHSSAAIYEQAAANAASTSDVSASDAPELQQCPDCGRSFAPAALARHAKVCAKVFKQTRKPMDMTSQRLAGAAFDSVADAPPTPKGKLPSKGAAASARAGISACPGTGDDGGKWKKQSDDLRSAMKASREVTRRLNAGESLADMPYTPSAPDPSLVLCPHCGRRFNEKAAERHIPACANTVNKPKFLRAGTGGAGKGAPELLKRVPGRK